MLNFKQSLNNFDYFEMIMSRYNTFLYMTLESSLKYETIFFKENYVQRKSIKRFKH